MACHWFFHIKFKMKPLQTSKHFLEIGQEFEEKSKAHTRIFWKAGGHAAPTVTLGIVYCPTWILAAARTIWPIWPGGIIISWSSVTVEASKWQTAMPEAWGWGGGGHPFPPMRLKPWLHNLPDLNGTACPTSLPHLGIRYLWIRVRGPEPFGSLRPGRITSAVISAFDPFDACAPLTLRTQTCFSLRSFACNRRWHLTVGSPLNERQGPALSRRRFWAVILEI